MYYVSDTVLNSLSNENTNNTHQHGGRIHVTLAYENKIEENGGKGQERKVRKSEDRRG